MRLARILRKIIIFPFANTESLSGKVFFFYSRYTVDRAGAKVFGALGKFVTCASHVQK